MFLDSFITPQLPPAFRYTLDDGTPAYARPIRPEDAPRLREGFRQLSALARRRRFFDQMSELTDEQLQQLTRIDQKNHAAWGAMNPEKPDEPGIGVARYIRLNGDPAAADVAITVAEKYQGHGAGMLLHACLHLTAHRNGIRTFCYDVLTDNERFIHQLKSLGAMHAGRADNIDRLSLPVYHRAWDVPVRDDTGKRFADLFRRLQQVEAVEA